ncbi:MAG: UDP-glucose/iron transport system permease protein [Methanothermococcus sp.]|uniref:ABC transporter permease n=1 Tax=Methanothermococcus TaxID=155862 RepID=UPI00036C74F7|nr:MULTISPECIES: iron export ABC transporter permease subunit FetB [Methanothermococcus]MDK2790349.1 UDP-glucose/iron transport system permease protein [Methanothermococcus sp.]MDK2987684.1 UDP-glucose/iron transport system permease protein [Methanothermococcus sp.]
MLETLIFSFSFVILALIVIYKEELGFGKEVLIAEILALVQLIILGYVINLIFSLGMIYAMAMVLAMIVVASFIVKRNLNMDKLNREIIISSFLSILTTATISLVILLFSKTIALEPRYIIPLMGMVVGNSTNVISLSLDRLLNDLKSNKDVLWGYLALGATEKQAVQPFIKKAIRSALTPQLNTAKAVGVIFIPGAMVGMLLSGIDPLYASKIQITIMWMVMSSAIISSLMACYLVSKSFIYKL